MEQPNPSEADAKDVQKQDDNQQAPTDGGESASPEKATLEYLQKTMGREFKDLEDATKSLTNLKSMVGDQALADLRNKAQEGEYFQKVVETYAKTQGLSRAEARKELLEEVQDSSSKEDPKAETPNVAADEIRELKEKFQEKELVELYPETKTALKEIKAIAKATGQDLREVYENSSLKEILKTAAEAEKAKEEKPSSSVDPNQRQGADLSKEADLVNSVKKLGRDEDKAELVAKYLGIK